MEAARRRLAEVAYPADVDSVAKLRLARGLSQKQLADAMATQQSYIAKIEAGHVRILLETAERMAGALGVSVDELSALLMKRTEINPVSVGV